MIVKMNKYSSCYFLLNYTDVYIYEETYCSIQYWLEFYIIINIIHFKVFSVIHNFKEKKCHNPS